jgi:hypothetical protein
MERNLVKLFNFKIKMSKVKSKDVKNIHGKKCGKNNNVPKEICSVIEKLEKLDFVEHIQLGDFRKSSNDVGIRIVGYDERLRKYNVNVNTGRYEHKVFLNVSERNAGYESSIKACF